MEYVFHSDVSLPKGKASFVYDQDVRFNWPRDYRCIPSGYD
jgi:hypothetical protein